MEFSARSHAAAREAGEYCSAFWRMSLAEYKVR